jgi:hypothetical protein
VTFRSKLLLSIIAAISVCLTAVSFDSTDNIGAEITVDALLLPADPKPELPEVFDPEFFLELMMPGAGETYTNIDFGFRFIRVKYTSINSYRGRGGWGGQHWATDYPAADLNLHTAFERTTSLRVLGDPLVLKLTDDRIFEYPVLYLTEPGYWRTDDREVENMRKYMYRGGFMLIDDFHDYGSYGREWYNMYKNIKRVFPDREPVLLEPDHPIWRIYYDIDPVEAPSTKPGFGRYNDQYYAIYDDTGRMMCFISYNQDIGDGWEWPNRNLTGASTVSFQMAINIVMYALTH